MATKKGFTRRSFLIGGAGVVGAGAFAGAVVLRNRDLDTPTDLPGAADPGPLQLQVGATTTPAASA